ncbi:MAG TPA: NUDIX hydrolase [Pilimelia sp.]|nr:NUDIX hydrolase [Pilimelia sp.]
MATGAQHSVSVAAIVVDDAGRILMTRRRDNGKWEPPGGVLELGESILDGLRREVREETGLDIEADCLTGVYKNMTRGIVALVFRAHATGGAQAHATDETTHLQWLTPAEVRDRCDEAYAVRVLDAISDTGPAIRAHDGVHLLSHLAALPN